METWPFPESYSHPGIDFLTDLHLSAALDNRGHRLSPLTSGGSLSAPGRIVYAQSEGSSTTAVRSRSATRPDRPQLLNRSGDRPSIPRTSHRRRPELAIAGRLRRPTAR